MKILVLSDSHGRTDLLEDILKKEARTCDIIVHCGDGADEMMSLNEYTYGKAVYLCKGNCDSYIYGFAELNTFPAEGKKIMACHGHRYNVKYGLTDLYFAAQENNADICLFGHTHNPGYEFAYGILFLNPGSVAGRSYATIEKNGDKLTPVMHTI